MPGLFSRDQEDDDYELSDLVDASDPNHQSSDAETDIDNNEVRYIFSPFFPSFSLTSHVFL
jgi:hypothetical protein